MACEQIEYCYHYGKVIVITAALDMVRAFNCTALQQNDTSTGI